MGKLIENLYMDALARLLEVLPITRSTITRATRKFLFFGDRTTYAITYNPLRQRYTVSYVSKEGLSKDAHAPNPRGVREIIETLEPDAFLFKKSKLEGAPEC